MDQEPMFDMRRAASIIRQHLIEQLGKLQERILLVERFGENAVTVPSLGIMGKEVLPEMMERHDRLVGQIKALTKALDTASEEDLRAFVDGLRRAK